MSHSEFPSVSHSEADSFLTCRRKHYYSYGLKLERVKHSDSLTRGSAGHAILETFYRAILEGEPYKLATTHAWQTYKNLEAKGMTGDDGKAVSLETMVFGFYLPNEPFARKGWQIWAVEKEFNLEYTVPTGQTYNLQFIIDLIAKNPADGKVYVIDHKFVYDFYTERQSLLMPQVPKYIGALRAMGFQVDDGIYNMIRTRSQTDKITVSKYIQQTPLRLTDSRIAETFDEHSRVTQEIDMFKNVLDFDQWNARAFRVANQMVCKSCQFYDLCAIDRDNGDMQLMIDTEFKTKERRIKIG